MANTWHWKDVIILSSQASDLSLESGSILDSAICLLCDWVGSFTSELLFLIGTVEWTMVWIL